MYKWKGTESGANRKRYGSRANNKFSHKSFIKTDPDALLSAVELLKAELRLLLGYSPVRPAVHNAFC